jgi:hypothetical protein
VIQVLALNPVSCQYYTRIILVNARGNQERRKVSRDTYEHDRKPTKMLSAGKTCYNSMTLKEGFHPFMPLPILPTTLYAEVAPLPPPLADHLYTYWVKQKKKDMSTKKNNSIERKPLFLREVAEKRRDVYLCMDSFVRNRDDSSSPYGVRFSTQWMRQELGRYTPTRKPISPKTWEYWLAAGFVRSERKGCPAPDPSAALYIVRMMLKGKYVLRGSMNAHETWWCYAQESPEQELRCISMAEIAHLHPHTLLWTPWPGASWDARWVLIGKDQGAIRFAGAKSIEGTIYYDVAWEDIALWKPDLAQTYKQGKFPEDQLQALARYALTQLAEERIGPKDEIQEG